MKLRYIIIGTLPGEERRVLLENLRGAEQQVCMMEQCGGDKPGGQAAFREMLAQFPASESVFLSGLADELTVATQSGMATVAYQPAGEEKLAVTLPPDMYAEGFSETGQLFFVRVYQRHHGIPWTILTTERCVVKEFSMDYLDALFRLYAGEGMTDYIEPLYPYEEERKYQEAYIEHMYGFYGYGMWIVCEKETGTLIGRVGIENREELGGELELGYAIGTSYQRQGYATEVCQAVMQYAREELGVFHLHCLIEEGNTVSEYFAGKLGFSYVGDMDISGKRMRKYMI